MRTIPYQPQDLAEPKPLIEAIRARRGGMLLNLDRMLLHSPPLAEGWNFFLRKVRNELTVDAKLRELAICAVAVLNRADYEFMHHLPVWLEAGGTQAQADALRALPAPESEDLFDAAERAVILLTVEMTRDVEVSDDTLTQAKAALGSDRDVVELVAVIAVYNMVSRFLMALKVEAE